MNNERKAAAEVEELTIGRWGRLCCSSEREEAQL